MGYVSDKTGKYWLVTITGYVVNMLAVPALALAGNWPLAAGLIVAERAGRAIRKPPTEAMLSFAGKHLGSGWVFGLNEALDQTGATVGPLVVAAVLFLRRDYQMAFAALVVSALLAITFVFVARYFLPRPHDLEAGHDLKPQGLPRSYWFYLLAAGCIAASFADFALIAYHFKKTESVPENLIPVFYAVAMGMGAVGALIFGKLFDKVGLPVVLAAFVLSSVFAPFVFWGKTWVALLGMVLWGIGRGAQESLLKAIVAGIVAPDKRGTAFGVFDTGFGIAWFLGSALMGVLYAHSLAVVVVLSVVLQLSSLPFFVLAFQRRQQG
jgi:predicted MFS family arabinose efflux permease